jgi:hypothetical protein
MVRSVTVYLAPKPDRNQDKSAPQTRVSSGILASGFTLGPLFD